MKRTIARIIFYIGNGNLCNPAVPHRTIKRNIKSPGFCALFIKASTGEILLAVRWRPIEIEQKTGIQNRAGNFSPQVNFITNFSYLTTRVNRIVCNVIRDAIRRVHRNLKCAAEGRRH